MEGLGPALVIVSVALPLALALATLVHAFRPLVLRVAPWAALPALVLALGVTHIPILRSEQLVVGTTLGATDLVSRGFLVLTATVWLASGLFAGPYMAADPHRVRFWGFFLASYLGNVGVVLARDVASFYVFYAVMTYAAFGLIVHEQTAEARRAGRTYLVMALAGEMLLLAAFVIVVGTSVNLPLALVPQAVAGDHLVVALVLAGFGIKAGALVLHVWLPLAHPVAPTPASAVLSGSMINAGLLGWLRFLPLGAAALPVTGLGCVIAGLTAAFYAVFCGLGQRDAKTILAYSSVSQMGFTTMAMGVALAAPDAVVIAIPAVVFYTLHHALAKCSLFLGTGLANRTGQGWRRRLVLLGLVWPALDIAGAPLSSGALAKISLKNVLAGSPWRSAAIGMLLSAGAVASTMLMVHFVVSLPGHGGRGRPRSALWGAWLLLFVLDVVLLIRPPIDRADLELLVRPANITSALWPVLAGVTMAVLVGLLRRRLGRRRLAIPAGDLVVVFDAVLEAARRNLAAVVHALDRVGSRLRAQVDGTGALQRGWKRIAAASSELDRKLATPEVTGVALTLLVLAVAVLAWARRG